MLCESNVWWIFGISLVVLVLSYWALKNNAMALFVGAVLFFTLASLLLLFSSNENQESAKTVAQIIYWGSIVVVGLFILYAVMVHLVLNLYPEQRTMSLMILSVLMLAALISFSVLSSRTITCLSEDA